jgi:hypothetical protein
MRHPILRMLAVLGQAASLCSLIEYHFPSVSCRMLMDFVPYLVLFHGRACRGR